MKTFYGLSIRSAVAVLIISFVLITVTNAQTPQYYNFNTVSSSNSFPFNIVLGKQIQLLYLPGDFNQPAPAPAGSIASLSFRISNALGPFTYTDMVIKLGQTNITAFDPGVWYTGALTTVYNRASVTLSSSANEWMTIQLDSPFPYDPAQTLILDIQQCGAPGASNFSSAVTLVSGARRTTSLINTGCPFAFGNQDSLINNIGFTFGSSSCNYSWVNQISGTTASLRTVFAVNDMVIWAGGTNGVVRKTTDGGVTWTDGNPNPGVINGLIYNINAIDENTAVCTTSPSDAFIYKTTNGGVNWTQVFTQTGGFINVIEFVNSTTGFAQGDPVGGRWSLWKTTDAGSTWDSSGLYLPQAGAEAGWVNSMSVIGDNIWFGTNNTSAYHSTDFGATWTSGATTGLLNSYSIHFNSILSGLAGGTAITKSTDGGTTFSDVGTIPGTGNINAIQGKDDDFWYIRGTGIYKSTDGGNTWTQDHSITGTGNDMSFVNSSGCLVGWAVSSTGAISKLMGVPVEISNNNYEIPESYSLEQNYPNPFNPTTTINFSIPRSGSVELIVYDILGKEITTLVKDFKSAGNYSVGFNASDLTSGTYFYKLVAGDFSEIRKMMLVK